MVAWFSLLAAIIGLVTAIINGVLQMRHREEDNRRFIEVHERINGVNGHDLP